MSVIISFLVGVVVGFVGGFLVFRNNQKKINEAELTVNQVVETVKPIVKASKKKKE